nr:hypothetical protein [Pantoea ananatis]
MAGIADIFPSADVIKYFCYQCFVFHFSPLKGNKKTPTADLRFRKSAIGVLPA